MKGWWQGGLTGLRLEWTCWVPPCPEYRHPRPKPPPSTRATTQHALLSSPVPHRPPPPVQAVKVRWPQLRLVAGCELADGTPWAADLWEAHLKLDAAELFSRGREVVDEYAGQAPVEVVLVASAPRNSAVAAVAEAGLLAAMERRCGMVGGQP